MTSTDYIDWYQVSPGTSGYCEMIWMHPTDSKTMIMSPDMFNTYGSWDGGESWLTVKDCDGMGKMFTRVQAAAFSFTNPDFGLATTNGTVMGTTNRGRSWEVVTEQKTGKQSAIAVDPTNDKIWYLGPGDFWNVKKIHFDHKSLEDQVGDKKVQGYIYKSTDRGITWTKKTTGLPTNIEVGRIIVNPAKSKEIFIATTKGIFKSTDGGESWKSSYSGIPNRVIRDMDYYYDAKSKEIILFALDQTAYHEDGNTISSTGGVYMSNDSAASWQDITGNLAIDLTKITDRSTTSWLYGRTMTHWFGITTKEFNAKFKQLPSNILSVFNRLRVNPKNLKEIYICGNVKHDYGFAPGDVWKTSDGGKSWICTARSGKYWIDNPDKEYWASRNNPTEVNTTYAHMQPNIDREAANHGCRFMERDIEGNIYACFEQQMVRSTDGGMSWHQYDDIETSPGSNAWVGRGASNLPGRYMMLETGVEGRMFFCSGEHGLWVNAPLENIKDEKQVAVRQIEGQLNPKGAHGLAWVAVDPIDPNIIYTIQFRQLHYGHLRRSTDGGKTWENISKPLPTFNAGSRIYQNSLTVDHKTGENIYFVSEKNAVSEVPGGPALPADYSHFGVHRSTDKGLTWEMVNNGFPKDFSVRRFRMDVDNPDVLYAALTVGKSGTNGGLYKSTNKGDQWEKMKIPAEIEAVNNIYQDRNTRALYISCGTPTGTAETGGVWRSTNEGKSWEKIFFMPFIWQTETSPVDPNIITVAAATTKGSTPNPGAYVSIDGGKSWMKVNKNLGQPDTIVDFKPDPKDTKKFWAALKGSGWTVGYVK